MHDNYYCVLIAKQKVQVTMQASVLSCSLHACTTVVGPLSHDLDVLADLERFVRPPPTGQGRNAAGLGGGGGTLSRPSHPRPSHCASCIFKFQGFLVRVHWGVDKLLPPLKGHVAKAPRRRFAGRGGGHSAAPPEGQAPAQPVPPSSARLAEWAEGHSGPGAIESTVD